MKRTLTFLATGVFALAVQATAASRDYKLEDRETIHHTFSNDQTLDVDQVNGAISIVADTGSTIRMDAEKIVRAADNEELARGKKEVVLDMNEKNGVAQLYVNGPFRNNDGHASQDHGFHDHNDRHYDVTFNFTIHVPKATALRLRTVNGKIDTDGTAGKFDVRTVNGELKMLNVAGSGSAETLNGNTTITFRENPKSDSSFKTLNGKVDVGLLPGLSADLSVKTQNGSAWTDFEATLLGSTPEKAEQKNGRFVYRSDKSSHMRVGKGGPELKFETMNGNIQIRKLAL